MRHLLWIIPLFLFISCGGNTGSNTATPIIESVKQGDYEITAIPGVEGLERAIKRNGVGRTMEEGTLLNGKKHGTWMFYDDVKQQIIEITNYHNGAKSGMSVKPKFARVEEKSYYANSVLHGPKETYGSTAKVTSSGTYINGKLEGKVVKYYDDGTTLKEESEYKNGVMHGNSKYFDEQGKVKLEYTYKNGKMVK